MNSTSTTRRMAQGFICALALVVSALLLQARENEVEHREIERSIRLTPTAAATSNTMGMARLEVEDQDGPRSNRIEIHTSGLATGAYAVTVFDRSGVNATVLGTFMAAGSGDESGNESSHSRGGGSGSEDSQRRGSDDGEGEAQFPVPDSINALDLGRLSITDGAGAEILAGDFNVVSSAINWHVSARVVAVNGDADDDAFGVAAISGRVRRGLTNGQFTLTGQNLPPNSTLTLLLNGEDKGEVRTNRRGRLHVRRNHHSLDVFSVSTVSVRDDSGREILQAHF